MINIFLLKHIRCVLCFVGCFHLGQIHAEEILYRNNLRNRFFDKEGPPTPSKTDSSSCFGITDQEYQHLASFFRLLFETTTAGYVLYGEKPFLLTSFKPIDQTIPGTVEHRQAIVYTLGLDAWKKFEVYRNTLENRLFEKEDPPMRSKTDSLGSFWKNHEQSNYVLANSSSDILNTIIFVNKTAFRKVVNENLPLVQFKLGPFTNAESLLDDLLNPEGFATVLKGQQALQGILLGYGVENSLTFERAHSFVKKILNTNKADPPFLEKNHIANCEDLKKRMITHLTYETNHHQDILTELADFSFFIPKEEDTISPKIPFSFHHSSSQSTALIEQYRQTEKQLQELYQNEHFIDLVLERLYRNDFKDRFCNQEILTRSKTDSSSCLGIALAESQPSNQQALSLLIAKSLKEMKVADQNLAAFVDGLKGIEPTDEVQSYIEYQSQLALEPERLEQSIQFLQDQGNQPHAVSLLKDRIIYRTLRPGTKPGIERPVVYNIKMHFQINDLNGLYLVGNSALSGPVICTSNELIPGLVHGMQGMRIGELREIHLHPEYVYGVFSPFGRGEAVTIQVELLDCEQTEIGFTPSFLPVDLAKLLPNSQKNLTDLEREFALFCGKNSWSFYKQQFPTLVLEEVIDLLQSPTLSPLSSEERQTLLLIHWQLYKNSVF